MALDFDFTPELAEFAHMTVVPGVTIGDMVFISAQHLYSTGAQAIASANTLPTNISVDLFKVGRGGIGQGFATNPLTWAETNFEDDNGRYGANEAFVAHSASVRVYKRSSNLLANTEIPAPLPPELINNVIYSCSWTLETADGIKRNMGLLAGYPAAGGAGGLCALPSAGSTTDLMPARGGVNGYPSHRFRRKLPVPVVFGPNLSNKIQIVNGTGNCITTGSVYEGSGSAFDGLAPQDGASALGTLATTDYLIFVLNFLGYRFTMPAPAAS